MIYPALWAIALGIGLLVWLWILLLPSGRRRLSAKWIREHRAPITDELIREVETARRDQQLGAILGGLIGLVAATAVTLRLDPTDDDHQSFFLFLLLIWFPIAIGTFAGRGVIGLFGAVREIRGPTRVVSARASRLTDYVSRSGLTVVRVEILLVVAALGVAIGLLSWAGSGFGPDESGPLWAVLSLLCLIWIAAEVVARRLVALPLPSTDAVTLFWRDALRGGRLRDICVLPASACFMVPTLMKISMPTLDHSVGPDLIFGASLAMFVVVMALTLIAQRLLRSQPSTQQHQALFQAARQTYQSV